MPRSGTSTVQIQTLGALPPPPERPGWLKDRIMEVVSDGVRWPRFRDDEPPRWEHRPGLMNWWVARQLVGGRVSAGQFAGAVETLLGEGLLVEVHLVRLDRRDAPHLLVQPGRFDRLPRDVARARGRPDVLVCEPWARSIAARPGAGSS